VRESWKSRLGDGDFERAWQKALHDGVVPGTASPARAVALRDGWAASLPPPAPVSDDGFEIVFRTDPCVYDGRFANNGWLQELPSPLDKVTWDNVASIAPADAERLGLENGDVVELSAAGRSVRAPVWISPGHATGAIGVSLGYGRTRAGRVGDGSASTPIVCAPRPRRGSRRVSR
jgi:molybdopterin-containing oxidoreductase family iron-sulfur binding subunit